MKPHQINTLKKKNTTHNNGVRRPREIRGPKIRANVSPKGPCWRHRVCHLGAIVVAWAARGRPWRWQDINVGNPLWRRALLLTTVIPALARVPSCYFLKAALTCSSRRFHRVNGEVGCWCWVGSPVRPGWICPQQCEATLRPIRLVPK